MGGREKVLALFEDNFLRLCAESEWFNKMYERACVDSRKKFCDLMKRELAKA